MDPSVHHPFVAADFALDTLTYPQVLARQAQRWPEKLFLHELATDRRLTFGEMRAWASRTAHALHAAGAEKGQHIGVLMENSAEHIALFFGAATLGAVWAPVNTAARGDLLRYYLAHADCTMLLVDAALYPRVAEVLDQLPLLQRIIVVGQTRDAALPDARQTVEVLNFHQLPSEQATAPEFDVRCYDLLMLAFTSGTTGPSKASMLSHAAALTYGTGAAQAQGYHSGDVFYVCLPLFHNNALLASMASALVCGGSVILSQRFSVSRFWTEIRDHRCTVTNLLGAMTSFLWSQPARDDDRGNHLRLVSMAPVPRYAQAFEERFGLNIMSNYGLSDFGMATSFTANDPKAKLGSIGRVRRGMQVRVVDDHDFEVPRGELGELVLRSDEPWRAAGGYYKMPEATLAAHRNQWFHTGDRGYCDEDGYFWFVDRKKDCIRRRGENISAFEVEQILMRHPAVAQAAVFPVSTDTNDEEVGVVIIRHQDQTLTPEDVIDHCARNMAYFMVPRYIEFRAELPTTANQKLEKFKLKQDFERDLANVWDREAAGIRVQR